MQKKLNINIEECKNKGITLIAFVITTIILLILAGLSISALTGSGLFGKANNVAKEYEKATIKEELQLAILDIQSMKRGNITREDLWDLNDIGAVVESIDIPAEGEYKNYFFEIDENYDITIFENDEREIEQPQIVVKDITFVGFTIEVNEDYNTENISEFVYYANGEIVNKGTRDKMYKVTGLKVGQEYGNIYVVAKYGRKRKKSNICSATVADTCNVLEEMNKNKSNPADYGFSLISNSGGWQWYDFNALQAGQSDGQNSYHVYFKWDPRNLLDGAESMSVTFGLCGQCARRRARFLG